ncbi:DsbC family protein [Chitinimonas sp. BJB300]|uniref:DsbC family protein n=1 Tax=Chitinimonas sp. BJB300 TaxID=1559339 RepID=UPI000C0ED050|nr:DsbC family protein [Chitinimonas sp. BJB300]PHV12213.1 thiol:disulfide interchange protein [Chitinimonas sp. BJB300]TSJ91618.1 DsbC family protein [Chitinimonas sp. BJB300]
MNFIAKRIAAASVGFALAACANAAGESPASVKAAMEKKFPQRPVSSVRATPVKGIYEVVLGAKQVVYTDAKAEYLFVGDMIQVGTRTSLTEARVRELSRTDFSALPLDKAIKEVRGNGARKVAVFSDPDCPFCKKLERDTITKLDNVTVYTFLMPLAQLHPDAARKSSVIWCASDRQKAWSNWILDGKLAEGDGSCATPLTEIAALAEKLDINGTPAMVFENGELVSGAIEAKEFEAKLNSKPTPKPTSESKSKEAQPAG